MNLCDIEPIRNHLLAQPSSIESQNSPRRMVILAHERPSSSPQQRPPLPCPVLSTMLVANWASPQIRANAVVCIGPEVWPCKLFALEMDGSREGFNRSNKSQQARTSVHALDFPRNQGLAGGRCCPSKGGSLRTQRAEKMRRNRCRIRSINCYNTKILKTMQASQSTEHQSKKGMI